MWGDLWRSWSGPRWNKPGGQDPRAAPERLTARLQRRGCSEPSLGGGEDRVEKGPFAPETWERKSQTRGGESERQEPAASGLGRPAEETPDQRVSEGEQGAVLKTYLSALPRD